MKVPVAPTADQMSPAPASLGGVTIPRLTVAHTKDSQMPPSGIHPWVPLSELETWAPARKGAGRSELMLRRDQTEGSPLVPFSGFAWRDRLPRKTWAPWADGE